ncbi:MAG: hypothetical protein WC076_13480 [Terrimicrobiaceae bacterium]
MRKNNGDLKEARRPGARTTKFFYDEDNRLVSSSNPGSNSGTRNEAFAYGTSLRAGFRARSRPGRTGAPSPAISTSRDG